MPHSCHRIRRWVWMSSIDPGIGHFMGQRRYSSSPLRVYPNHRKRGDASLRTTFAEYFCRFFKAVKGLVFAHVLCCCGEISTVFFTEFS